MNAGTHEARGAPRRRVFKGAQISFYGLHAAIDCTVRDISDTGARLNVETPVGIPEIFDLVVAGGLPRRCRVVWRAPKQLGVAFVTEGGVGASRG